MGWNFREARNDRVFSDINITPLTDVMLVLLVIFMVTTPLLMAESFKINLPRAVTAGAEPGLGITVEVSGTGSISVNGRAVEREALLGVLKEEIRKASDKIVVLKADGAVRHKLVVEVLDTAKLAGAQRLSIATVREEREAGPPD